MLGAVAGDETRSCDAWQRVFLRTVVQVLGICPLQPYPTHVPGCAVDVDGTLATNAADGESCVPREVEGVATVQLREDLEPALDRVDVELEAAKRSDHPVVVDIGPRLSMIPHLLHDQNGDVLAGSVVFLPPQVVKQFFEGHGVVEDVPAL